MKREREDFFFTMARECPTAKPYDIRTILKWAGVYQRLQEEACNGVHPDRQAAHDRREKLAIERLKHLGAALGFEPVFSGDPRGSTVKLKVASGRTDDWGQVGICVPTEPAR